MKTVRLIFIFFSMLTACYELYDADIEADEKVLTVDGLITDDVASYYIRLNYARPFDSYSTREPVSSARVFITDDLGRYYQFREVKNGIYRSDSLLFTGMPGRTYVLEIAAPDGEIYRSAPQKLMKANPEMSVYADYDFKEILSTFTGTVQRGYGADIKVDLSSQKDPLPHFRITSDLVKQYFYALEIPPPFIYPPLYSFYCWQTDKANPEINLTEYESLISFASVKRHEVCFIDDQYFFEGLVYSIGPRKPDGSYIGDASTERETYTVSKRILYLNRYTLNNDSYLYYKNMDEQLRSEGRLFDPISVQLKGNIACMTREGKKAFGFFEASSVSHSSYTVGFRNTENQYSIKEIQYLTPPVRNGCWINKVPPFWIY